jgi:hypothetical protein
LGYTSLNDWYNTKQADFHKNHGKNLLNYYSSSHRLAITSILHEHPWEMWRFQGKFQTLDGNGTEAGDPKNTEKIRGFVEELKSLCKVQQLEDWYRISTNDVDKVGKKALVRRSGGLLGTFPSFNYA